MKFIDVIVLCAGLFASLFLVSGIFYHFAMRKFSSSMLDLKRLADVANRGNALEQSIFQLYKELSVHNAITIQTAERFKSEFKKTISK